MKQSDAEVSALINFLTALGAADFEVRDDGHVEFYVDHLPAIARVLPGGVRFFGKIYLDDPSGRDAQDWIDRQPQPEAGVLEARIYGPGEQRPIISWERHSTAPTSGDPLFEEALIYADAWLADDEVEVEVVEGVPPFVVSRNPQDLEPANAWLLKGTRAAYPTTAELAVTEKQGRIGVFAFDWTAAKQTEEGDLALIYFMAPDKAVHFVTRAASPAFFDRSIEVNSPKTVSNAQWWAYFTPPIEIEPISLADLKAAADAPLLLRGRSGTYLRPQTISRLTFTAKDGERQALLDQVVRTPTGLAELPTPSDITVQQWRALASGALPLEAKVSEYVVEPLLNLVLEGSGRTWQKEYRVGAKLADYVVLDGDHPRCVVEVKLTMLESPTGDWADSKDFRQMQGYASDLGCGSVLIDASRVLLVKPAERSPHRVIQRRHATPQDLDAIRDHLLS